jgi:hypothetical protein
LCAPDLIPASPAERSVSRKHRSRPQNSRRKCEKMRAPGTIPREAAFASRYGVSSTTEVISRSAASVDGLRQCSCRGARGASSWQERRSAGLPEALAVPGRRIRRYEREGGR